MLFADTIKENAEAEIDPLKTMGLEVIISTSDKFQNGLTNIWYEFGFSVLNFFRLIGRSIVMTSKY